MLGADPPAMSVAGDAAPATPATPTPATPTLATPTLPATGDPFAIAAKLRVDHGAIAALLVPTPTAAIVADLLSILVPHNRLEEEAAGIYELCDTALGAGAAEQLIEKLRAFPEPPLKPYNDGPGVMKHVAETLAASRRQWT